MKAAGIPAETIIIPDKIMMETQSMFVEILLAAIGGVFVVIGLLMEHFGDRNWYEYKCLPEKRSKSLKWFGEWFVIFGVGIEVLVAAVTAYGERQKFIAFKQQMDEAKTNIAQIDWRKQPIYAFEATATLIVRPLAGDAAGFENLPKAPWFPPVSVEPGNPPYNPQRDPNQTWLYFGRAVDMAKGPFVGTQAMVQSDKVERSLFRVINENEPMVRFDIHFHANARDTFDSLIAPNNFDAIQLLVPIRCEIEWGELKMSFDNDLTNRTFQIPKQMTLVHMASSVETNGVFVPMDFDPKFREQVEKDHPK